MVGHATPSVGKGDRIRTLISGALLGPLIGAFFAANAYMVIESWMPARWTRSGMVWPIFFIEVLIHLGVRLAPGALLVGLVLTRALYPFMSRLQNRRHLVMLGMALGLPLGALNMVAVSGIGWFPFSWVVLVPGFANGAGIGLACALVIPFTRREAKVESGPEH